jgi:glucosylceramidase
MDWNMLLDQQGGPNHVGNYCDAPIIASALASQPASPAVRADSGADTTAGTVHVQPPYYYMGHLSRFLTPGSRRVGLAGNLHATAVLRPDGQVAVVVQNMGDSEQVYKLQHGGLSARLMLPAHGIHTLLYTPPQAA